MAVCEKRSLEETVHSAKNVLLDIEGTTTSISFVKDTLFPYVRKCLESYVSANWDKDEFKEVLTLLREQATTDVDSKVEGVVAIPSEGSVDEQQAAVVSNVLWQMDNDRKTTALKKLQGLVWRLGYKDGELKGHVYPDVAPALRRWTENGRKLYVYSSGSVEAQKLLFKYSQEGDLSELFSGHFDTTVGPKVEAESYKAIAKSLDCNPDNLIFLTDVPKEASAAREAGLPVVLVTREDAEELSADEKGDFSSVSTLEDVQFSASAVKRQKVDETEANGVSEEKAPVEKMDVEETEETPKTEVAEKEEPKTEVAEVEEKTVSEKVTETKEETVEKMEEDSEAKVEEKPEEVAEEKKVEEAKPVEKEEEAKPVEKKEEEVKPVEETKEVKPVEAKKEEEAKPVEKKEDAKPVEKKEEEAKPVEKEEEAKPVEKKEEEVKPVEKEEVKPVEKEEEVKPVEKKEEVKPVEKKEEVKPVDEAAKPSEKAEKVQVEETKTPVEEEKVEKSEEKKEVEKVATTEEEAKPVEEKVEESKTEEVKKAEEPKVEEKSEEKSEEKVEEEKTVEKAEEAVEAKADEVEKAVEAKEGTEESKKEESEGPKQNGVENGSAVNGVSNGKSENGVNGKEAEAHAEEVVVKKGAAAAPAEAEVAAEA